MTVRIKLELRRIEPSLMRTKSLGLQFVLAGEIKYGRFDVWPQRLDRIEGERKAASIVGVQITDRRMRAMSGERHGEPPGRDGKDDVQKSVERMRCVTLRSGLAKCSR